MALFDRLPKPSFQEQVEGTRAFFRELNRLGITGVGDPGGNNLAPPDYAALFDVWRRGQMNVRVRYSLNGQTPGAELQDFKTLTGLLPMGFGDPMLRFIGLGERAPEKEIIALIAYLQVLGKFEAVVTPPAMAGARH